VGSIVGSGTVELILPMRKYVKGLSNYVAVEKHSGGRHRTFPECLVNRREARGGVPKEQWGEQEVPLFLYIEKKGKEALVDSIAWGEKIN